MEQDGSQDDLAIATTTLKSLHLPIHLVDKHDTRNAYLLLGAIRFRTAAEHQRATEHNTAPSKNTQGTLNFNREINVPRGINDIDAMLSNC